MPLPVYAQAGEKVTCENGHHICDIVQDLHIGHINWRACFGNWQQPEPSRESEVQICDRCSAPWLRNHYDLHFEAGWRPLKD